MRQIILDTETTGLSPENGHRVIEIGCLEMINRRLTGNYLHFYLNPERAIERAASDIHGITEQFLADKPLFKDIADELVNYIRDAELIIHNAPFDVGFLNHELKLTKRAYVSLMDYCSVVDTLALARRKHPGQQNNLDALCKRYHVDNSNRTYHGALLDAELLAQVYLLMTGGQSQLFDSTGFSEVMRPVVVERVVASQEPLTVVRATAEEMEAHRAYVDFLKKKSETCWWPEENTDA